MEIFKNIKPVTLAVLFSDGKYGYFHKNVIIFIEFILTFKSIYLKFLNLYAYVVNIDCETHMKNSWNSFLGS